MFFSIFQTVISSFSIEYVMCIIFKLSAPREKSLIRSGLRDIERAAPCIRYVEYSEGDSRLPNTYVQVLKGQG